MDDLTVEDDKKRFDPEAAHEEDMQPDPDEELMLDRGNGRVWLVKVSMSFSFNTRGPKRPLSCLPNFEESRFTTRLTLILKGT